MRTSAKLNERKKKILYRAWHRGMKELDLILGKFADEKIAEMSEEKLNELEQLLNVNDPQLYQWLCKPNTIPNDWKLNVIFDIVKFHNKN